jgi:hypothetical protein
MILRPLLPMVLAAALLPTLTPASADAAPHGKPKKGATAKPGGGEAKRHLDAGSRLFKAGDYTRARGELEQAYRLSPQPATLHMLAECNFKLNDYGAAYAAYEKVAANPAARAQDQADAQRMLKVLDPLMGQVDITSAGPPADLSIDGRVIGKTPLDKPVRLGAGPHKIHTSVNGTSTGDTDVTVKAGETVAVKLEAGGEAAGDDALAVSGAKGKVTIEITPAEAAIMIDGEEMGKGKYEGDLPAGPHRLSVLLAGYKNEAREVTITEGKTATLTITMDPEEEGGDAPAKKTDDAGYAGLYASATAFGAIPVLGTTRIPAYNGGNGTSSPQLGGGFALRLGHSFGTLGIEGALAFLGETHQERHAIPGATGPSDPVGGFAEGNIQRTDAIGIYSLGGFAGIGPRITTAGESVRFTFGATPGISIRRFSLHREVGGSVVDSYITSATATSFSVNADASVMFGKTPGLKVIIGVFVWADFASRVDTPSGDPRVIGVPVGNGTVDVALPTPPYTMLSGPQIFVGPQVGVRFGR